LGWGLSALTTVSSQGSFVAWPGIVAAVAGLIAAGAAFTIGRRWRQKALEREEQLNHSILGHAAHCVISTDAQGRIETFSSGAERLLGFKPHIPIEQGLADLVRWYQARPR